MINPTKLLLFLTLVGGSGVVTFMVASHKASQRQANEEVEVHSTRPLTKPSRRSESTSPLPLDKRRIERMDPTNYEVTVSDIKLEEIGRRIERESRERLRQLTDRYQLTANQRREAFPLLVSYHADYTEGLIVNGFAALPPRENQLNSELYLIMDLFQQESFQEDVLADNEWWGDILDQLRSDLDDSLYSNDDSTSPAKRPATGDEAATERRTLTIEGLFGN